MRRRSAGAAVALTALLVLGACDKPKVRHVPADPFATPAPPAATVPPLRPGVTAGLVKLPQFPGFYVDRIGSALDPMAKPPAVTPGEAPIVISGFGFDAVAKAPGRGVELLVDGKPYIATYGGSRTDVASYFKTPALEASGYTLTLPGGTLAAGPHTVAVRVIATDARGYFQAPTVGFTVR